MNLNDFMNLTYLNNMKLLSLIIINLIVFNFNGSCQIQLPKNYYTRPSFGTSEIFYQRDTIDFDTRINEYKYNYFQAFFKNSNNILYSENNYYMAFNRYKSIRNSYLYLATLEKEIIDTIYISRNIENVNEVDLSLNDSILIISVTTRNIINLNRDEDVKREIVILNYKTKTEINRINISKYFSYSSSVFNGILSPNGRYFVFTGNAYSIDKNKKDSIMCGVNIIDIRTGEIELISTNGRRGIWSSQNNYIAYHKKNGVWLYNIKTKNHKLLFEIKEGKQRIGDIKFTPDGKNVFVQVRTIKTFWHGGILTPFIINIESKEIIKGGELYKYGTRFQWK